MSNETKKEECGFCCKLVPPRCKNKDCLCHSSPHIPTGEEEIKTISDFLRVYCNNHNGKIRWLRGIFIDEEDKIEKILSAMRSILLSKEKQWKDEMAGKIEKMKIKNPQSTFKSEIDEYIWHENNGVNKAIHQILSLLSNNQS